MIRRIVGVFRSTTKLTLQLEGRISNIDNLHQDDADWLTRQFPDIEWRIEEWNRFKGEFETVRDDEPGVI